MPEIEHYRAFSVGLKALAVFVSEDHSQAEALAGPVFVVVWERFCYERPDSPVKAKVYQRLFSALYAHVDASPGQPCWGM